MKKVRRRSRLSLVIPLLLLLQLLLPTISMANGVFEHQDTVVPENQTVDDVVVIGGDATILGTVSDSVVVVNGDAILRSTADVKGFILVLGGHVRQEPGAAVEDEIVSFSLDDATKNSLLIGGGLVVGLWIVQFAASLLLILLTALAAWLGRRRIRTFADEAFRTPGLTLTTGVLCTMILVAASVLLLITVIGIPLLILLWLAAALVFVWGLAALSLRAGERVRGTAGDSDWLTAALGSVIWVSLMNVPVLGALVTFVVLWFSLGSVIQLLRIRRK